MEKKILILLIISFVFIGCSKQPLIRYKQNHHDYLERVNIMKKKSSPSEYQAFIKTQIQQKELELTNIESLTNNVQNRHSESESQETLNEGDINHFKANNARIELHQLSEKRKWIERQLFFLKSQLSAGEK